MDAWQNILKTALLGAQRDAGGVLQIPGTLGEVVQAACEKAQPADALLRSAAIIGTARLAGYVPMAVASVTPAAPAETLPVCPSGAAAYLWRMLAGEHQEALPEFLGALARAERRVPHACLPELLTAAAGNGELRPLVRAVMGQRGVWLMQQNAPWQFDSLQDDDAAWETGTREVRIAAFARMRCREPGEALRCLTTSWQKETPEDRADLLGCLAGSLSMSDEPFLEMALDDRRKEVRKAAADLLLRLPESRLVGRMIERLRGVLKITIGEKRRLLGLGSVQQTFKLEIALPEACDKAMVRDGIESKPPRSVGEKAWWLEQIIAGVPLTLVPELADNAPRTWIDAAGKTDFADALLRGWAQSASRHKVEAWVRGLLAWQIGLDEREQDAAVIEQLMEALPEKVRDAAAISATSDRKLTLAGVGARAVLLACPRWSDSLSRAVLNQISHMGSDDASAAYALRELAIPYALRTDTALADEVKTVTDNAGVNGHLAKVVETFAAMVQFRHDMLKEIGR